MRLMPWRATRTPADAYAVAVGRELRDLRRQRRRRLLDDLRRHLSELPAGSDLAATLGAPKRYAEDLRSSNGIAPPHGWGRVRRVPVRLRVALVLALITAVAASIGGVWISQYQPLVRGLSYSLSGTRADPVFGGASNVVVDFQQSAMYQFDFAVRNGGSVGVDVVDVPLQLLHGFPLVMEEVLVMPPRAYCCRENARPFQPFSLAPGEERGLVFRSVMEHCQSFPDGGSISVSSLDLRFRVLGITKTQKVDLPAPLAVRMPGTDTPQCRLPRPPLRGPSNGVGTDTLVVLSGGTGLVVQAIAPVIGTGLLARAAWSSPPACSDTPPVGLAAVPVDFIVSSPPNNEHLTGVPLPVDLHFSLGGPDAGGSVLVATSGSPGGCVRSGRVHIEQIDEGGVFVAHGIAELPKGACGSHLIDVQLGSAGGASVGTVRLDVACPAG
ncbi:MAG TPA: hypothetical protein VGQ42_16820 [Candidatus Dormibacteraeota bacterium]|jgi:hypothetical protein|nr:hypothetical protein [Candidatus Dormibacteraeota bacterium]